VQKAPACWQPLLSFSAKRLACLGEPCWRVAAEAPARAGVLHPGCQRTLQSGVHLTAPGRAWHWREAALGFPSLQGSAAR